MIKHQIADFANYGPFCWSRIVLAYLFKIIFFWFCEASSLISRISLSWFRDHVNWSHGTIAHNKTLTCVARRQQLGQVAAKLVFRFLHFQNPLTVLYFRITSTIQGHFQTMIFETPEAVGCFRLLLSNFRRLLLACGSMMWVGSIDLHLLFKNWCTYYYIAALCSKLGYYDSWCVSYEKPKLMYKPFLWVHTLGKPRERTAMCYMVNLETIETDERTG